MTRSYVKGRWDITEYRRGFKRIHTKPRGCSCYMCAPRTKFNKQKTTRKYDAILRGINNFFSFKGR